MQAAGRPSGLVLAGVIRVLHEDVMRVPCALVLAVIAGIDLAFAVALLTR